ncbi:MAG TPA: tetratricopeptide repeat protein, partial [Alphaproteobacteria bacterium]|nr:tetratricopeptide repeat protein [Alphaproteobacteria bacterium]
GRPGEALDAFDRALEIDRDWAEAHYNRANALTALGRSGDGEAALRRAIGLKPAFAGAWNNLGLLLAAGGRFNEAVAAYRRALAEKSAGGPEKPDILNNLGNALQALERLDEAEEILRRALELAPGDGRLHLNLGGILQDRGMLDAAGAAYAQAVSLCPDDVDARLRLAMLALLAGDLEAGFEAYEWRWRDPGFIASAARRRAPGWTGEDLKGKRLLLWAEQGFGDAIQFARFATLAAARGAEVSVECPKPLVRLFETLIGVAAVTEPGRDDGDFDFQAPLMSLPRAFGVSLGTIPAAPYLFSPYLFSKGPAGRDDKLPVCGLNVGLVWAGSESHKNDRKRSLDPALLEPLTSPPGGCPPGVNFFSLQAAAANIPPGVARLGCPADFAETAALIAGLDLVISVDTAVAHLAGALGRPVWIMLPFAPDWRWLRGRDDSPWYPTARLFRQRSPGDWPGTVEALGRALARFA